MKNLKSLKWDIFLLLSVLLVSISCAGVFGQANEPCNIQYTHVDIKYSNISEKAGFTETVSYKGILRKNKREVIDVAFTELEKVSELRASYKDEKNKSKSIKDFGTRSLLTSSFYAGINSRTFVLEPQSVDYEFEYGYKLTNSNLMFLSFLPFNSRGCVDTFSYTISLPANLNLKYNVVGDTSKLKYCSITKIESNETTEWKITAITNKRVQVPAGRDYGIEPSDIVPGIRLSIVPVSVYENDFAYMNDWFSRLLLPQSELNAESVAVIEKWVSEKSGSALVKALFDSVKMKISYVAFENGIGAVQPRNVNDVLRNKQGDCKDMSNLLRQCIRHFGIPAWLAISSTITHPYDLDFPSLSSANHAICVAKVDDKTFYLDPTESFGLFGFPSRQIQGKNILIIDSVATEPVKIEAVPSKANKVSGIFNLIKQGDKLSGTFSYKLTGLSKIDIETALGTNSMQSYNEALKSYLTAHFKNMRIDSLRTLTSDSSVTITGFATSNNSIIKIDNSTYLSQTMLMFPHLYPKLLTEGERLIFYEKLDREFEFKIQIDEPFQLRQLPEEKFSSNGFSFDYNVHQTEPHVIRIYYYLNIDHLEVNKNHMQTYNELNDKIVKTFNKKIAYE